MRMVRVCVGICERLDSIKTTLFLQVCAHSKLHSYLPEAFSLRPQTYSRSLRPQELKVCMIARLPEALSLRPQTYRRSLRPQELKASDI